jgi:hypothetical protein
VSGAPPKRRSTSLSRHGPDLYNVTTSSSDPNTWDIISTTTGAVVDHCCPRACVVAAWVQAWARSSPFAPTVIASSPDSPRSSSPDALARPFGRQPPRAVLLPNLGFSAQPPLAVDHCVRGRSSIGRTFAAHARSTPGSSRAPWCAARFRRCDTSPAPRGRHSRYRRLDSGSGWWRSAAPCGSVLDGAVEDRRAGSAVQVLGSRGEVVGPVSSGSSGPAGGGVDAQAEQVGRDGCGDVAGPLSAAIVMQLVMRPTEVRCTDPSTWQGVGCDLSVMSQTSGVSGGLNRALQCSTDQPLPCQPSHLHCVDAACPPVSW